MVQDVGEWFMKAFLGESAAYPIKEGSGSGVLLRWNLPFAGSVQGGVFDAPL